MRLKKEFEIYLKRLFAVLKNKKILKITGVIFLMVLIVGSFNFYYYYNSPLKIGFIADIHAGDQSRRDDGEEADNVLIPKNFEQNIKKALTEMGRVDLVVVLGDSLNRPSRKNTKKLLEITSGYPVVWVKGNHDKLLHFNELLSEERYYYVDKKKWRLIVLDNSATYPDTTGIEEHGRGYIDEKQLNWLKEKLKTKKRVIIAMHLPMLKRGGSDVIREDYKYLEELFIQSGNVKHIFSGHFHIYDKDVERDGIIHHIIPSLSLSGKEGYYYKEEL